jgi:hypothetical protein
MAPCQLGPGLENKSREDKEQIPMTLSRVLKTACLWGSTLALASTLAYAAGSFTGSLNTMTTVASTIPANGDVNPYGVAIVPRSTGNLTKGNILVSNFNNSSNLQGTGTTIVQISPQGTLSVFAQIPQNLAGCPGGVGLTTALVALRSGWVIVGSLPTTNGMAATAEAGCLIVLNNYGHVAETFAGKRDGVAINGPWDMTALDTGELVELFVTNVLDGTVAANGNVVNRGTVVRILLFIDEHAKPRELLRTEIGSGFPQRTDPNALVIGPTGVGLGPNGTLYVADSLSNRIAAIPNAVFRFGSAGIGKTVSENGAINGPLGLAIASDGDILTVNSGDGNLVETTPGGMQVVVKGIDVSGQGAGTLFGLAVVPGGVYYVDDGNNTLNLLH